MKRFLLVLFTALFAFSWHLDAQISIVEGLNSGLPSGWTQSGYFSSTTSPCEGSGSLRDNLYSSSTSGNITTSNQVAASNGTDITVSYQWQATEWSAGDGVGFTAVVEYSTDGGSNWNNIGGYSATAITACTPFNATIPGASVPNGSDFQFRIVATWDSGDCYHYVDDISITQVALSPPNCDAALTTPTNGATDVAIDTDLSWSAATGGPTGYKLQIGTTMGGSEFLPQTDVGLVTTYDPATDFAYSTTYYVTITPYNANGDATGCTEESFMTEAAPPQGSLCTDPIPASLPYNTTDNTSNYGDDYSGSAGSSGCGSTSSYLNGDDVVYVFTPSSNSCVSIDVTALSSTYAGVFVYDDCSSIGTSCLEGDVNGSSTADLQIIMPVSGGTPYYVVISTWASPQSTGYTLDIAELCADPSSQTTTNLAQTSVDLGWTENCVATTWEIEYGANGFTQGTGTVVSTSSNPYSLTGLTPSTMYDWYVRADCGGGSYSGWIGPNTFTTAAACGDPSSLAASNITETTATLGWTSINAGATYTVEYGADGFTPGTGTTMSGTSVAGANSVNVGGLTPGTAYDFYVQEDCGGGDVTTNVGPADFNTLVPGDNCTNAINLAGQSSPLNGTTVGAVHDFTNTCAGGNIGSDLVYYIEVPDGARLSIGQTSNAYDSEHVISYGASCPSTATSISTTQLDCQDDPDIETFVWDNTTGASQTVWFVLDGYSTGFNSAGTFTLEWLLELCPAPSAQTTANITTSSVDLGWTENGSATSWDIEYGATGFTQGTGTTVNVGTNPYSLSGLTGGTTYDWYVRAACGGANGNSDWVGPNTFTTLTACSNPSTLASSNVTTTTADLTWTENGTATAWDVYVATSATPVPISSTPPSNDNVNANNPYNLTGLTGSTTYYVWVRADCDPGNNNTDVSNWVGPESFSTVAVNDLCSGALPLTADPGTACGASTIVGISNANTSDSGEGTPSCGSYGTPTTRGDLWYVITAPSGIVTFNVQNVSGLTSVAGAIYSGSCGSLTELDCTQFGSGWPWEVTGLTVSTQYYVRVWDYGNDQTGTFDLCAYYDPCPAPTTQTEASITQTSVDLGWTEVGTATTWEIEYGANGFTQGTGTVVSTSTNPHSLSGLTASTQYDWYVRADCGGATYSGWVGPSTFTTLDPCGAPSNTMATPAQTTSDFSWVAPGSGNTPDSYEWVVMADGAAADPGTAVATGTETHPDVMATATGLTAGTDYDFYVRTNCDGGGSQSSWTAKLDFSTTLYTCTLAGQTTTCSPAYNATSGNGDHHFYDSFEFTVGTAGNYDILGEWTGFDGYIYLYQNSFDPNSPSTNLVIGDDDYNGTGASLIEGQSLSTGVTYIVIGTSYNDDNNFGAMSFTISGTMAAPNCPGATSINGVAQGAAGSVATGSTYAADYECTDVMGWTHYYEDNGSTTTFGDDIIVLSVMKNGNSIGTAGTDLTAQVEGSGAVNITNPPALYVSNPNWYTMGRYWNVTPASQPASPVSVRFYFTSGDVTAVQSAIAGAGGTPPAGATDMRFYKVNGAYNADPGAGHTNVPLAATYDADGYWELSNGGASLSSWAIGIHDGESYAEYSVASFSGGGGGSGGAGEGALPIELIYFKGQAMDAGNKLTWVTASETNSRSHIIERSANGIDLWTEVGQVAGAGTTLAEISYALMDEKPLANGYYRLKAVDFDGQVQVSQTINIKREIRDFAILDVFPVPTSDKVNVNVNLPEAGELMVTVTDVSGKTLQMIELDGTDGLNQVQVDLSSFGPGLYFVQLDNGLQKLVQRVVKQ